MRRIANTSFVPVIVLCFLAALWSLPSASAQRKGEYLTDDEMTLVQDLRRIDNRAMVFLMIAERRLIAVRDPNAQPKGGHMEDFGPLPKGSQVELLDDYRRAVDELMAKLDDEYERTGMTKELYAALTYTKQEITRQLGEIDALKPVLTQPDAGRFASKARESAEQLDEGTTAALSEHAPASKP